MWSMTVALLQRSRDDCQPPRCNRAQMSLKPGRSAQPPRFQAERRNPAVLHLRRFTSAKGKTTSQAKQTDSFLDITLISPSGQPEGR